MVTPQKALRHHAIVVWCVLALVCAAPSAFAQQPFSTPDAAMNAFGHAVLNNDEAALRDMLGKNFRDVIPPVDAEVRKQFIHAWSESHSIQSTDGHAFIAVGDVGWTLPIPLVKSARGWQFDIQAGVQEMRVRRIGRNELAAIQTLLAICDAQAEYSSTTYDGESLHVYASKLASSPGKHDGLYWPTAPNEPPSPLGPAFSDASRPNQGKDGYNGYRFKLLTSQGPQAHGGTVNYMLDGKLFAGFAVIAWPVRYGDTGVMTFIVNQFGVVYEQNLGPSTSIKAAGTASFNPARGWRRVSP